MNQVVKWDAKEFLGEIVAMQEAANKLANTKHYSKLGADGMFAIMQMAKVINIHPLIALNEGLYYLQGRVGMYAKLMNQMVRQAGHSIVKDPKSNAQCCILHGKRKDTGDTITVPFSIADAQKAGIYKTGGAWEKWPEDMLFARALGRLCRQLFPDVTAGMYVKEEIEDIPTDNSAEWHEADVVSETIEPGQVQLIENLLQGDPEGLSKVLKSGQVDRLEDIPKEKFHKLHSWCQERSDKRLAAEMAQTTTEEVKGE